MDRESFKLLLIGWQTLCWWEYLRVDCLIVFEIDRLIHVIDWSICGINWLIYVIDWFEGLVDYGIDLCDWLICVIDLCVLWQVGVGNDNERVVEKWNELPLQMKNAPSITVFKASLIRAQHQ